MMKQAKKHEFLYIQGPTNVVFCTLPQASITGPRKQHIHATSRSTSHIKNYNIKLALQLTFMEPVGQLHILKTIILNLHYN